MKIYFTIACLTLLVACGNRASDEQEIPESLNDNDGAESYSLSKRGDRDLVNSLYAGLRETDPDIKSLEEDLTRLEASFRDSTELFSNYHSKNMSYYSSASRHVLNISDSVLREKVKSVVLEDSVRYGQLVSMQISLMDSIALMKKHFQDLHEYLKIIRTLPVIRKFQEGNLPSVDPLTGYANRVDAIIRKTDSLIKK